jgi:hypothetical protein
MATTEPQKWAATLGSTADVNAIPATTPSGSGRASFSGLFPPVTQLPLDQGGIAPERGDFNALFKYLGEYLFYLMQGGTFSYSTDYDYTAGNLVMHGGSLYLCIASNGPGSAIKYPTDAGYWRQLAVSGEDSSGNGWVRFKNGVQICGQSVVSINAQVFTVNFPRAFTSIWSVTITNEGNIADANVYGKIHGAGTSSFDILTNVSSSAWYWMAIGTWK